MQSTGIAPHWKQSFINVIFHIVIINTKVWCGMRLLPFTIPCSIEDNKERTYPS